MSSFGKLLAILLCVSLCGVAAIISLQENRKSEQPKTKVVPIDNHQPNRGIWIWAVGIPETVEGRAPSRP